MAIIKCTKCGKEDLSHSKGLCFNCYRKFVWKPKPIVCKRCGREKPNHAKGFCSGCYQFVFHLDKNKAFNIRKRYGLDMPTYKKITEKCIICEFSHFVDLHHLNGDKKNNTEGNLVGLCPNHHRMLHDFRYKGQIIKVLKDKNYVFAYDEEKLRFSND